MEVIVYVSMEMYYLVLREDMKDNYVKPLLLHNKLINFICKYVCTLESLYREVIE